MLSEIVNWSTVCMVVVSVLGIYAGIKAIDRMFEVNKKKKSSLF